ncbi:MAG TPA: triose-phosphate isomerase family protein [Candidatus Paceibacterota bacterium]|nr:triose-phosphate isomerase family protein [Candidatus Paceibacterota bacterium]
MKKLIIAANWKLYIHDAAEAKKNIAALKRMHDLLGSTELLVLPPLPLIPAVVSATKGSGIAVGAQAVSPFEDGAYTGYVSAQLVQEVGATWALVGHSEQRAQVLDGIPAAGATLDLVAAQVRAAHAAGLRVLLCVGEHERDPSGAHFSEVAEQLQTALAQFPNTGTKLAIAYEPVWAIGKSANEACTPADLEEMVIFIRRTLTELFDRKAAAKVPILYGGSVDAGNARELLVQGGASGLLVGRASTDAKTFIELLRTIQQ